MNDIEDKIENGIQQHTTLEEQLEKLKKEQAEAEETYRGRIKFGDLNHNPASIQQLAQTILERKSKIDDLEAQIAQSKDTSRETDTNRDSSSFNKQIGENEQQAMTVYTGRNPILRWVQKIIDKIEQRIQKIDERSNKNPMDRYKEKNFEQEMEYLKKNQNEEYNTMAQMKNVKKPTAQTAHQRFEDKISGNGAYRTNGLNYKKQEPEIDTEKYIQETIESKKISER